MPNALCFLLACFPQSLSDAARYVIENVPVTLDLNRGHASRGLDRWTHWGPVRHHQVVKNQGVCPPQPEMFWGSPILHNSLLLHCKRRKAIKITFHSKTKTKTKNITDILVLQRFPQIYRACVLVDQAPCKNETVWCNVFLGQAVSKSLSTAEGPQCFYIPQLSTGHPSWPPAWISSAVWNRIPRMGMCVCVWEREREREREILRPHVPHTSREQGLIGPFIHPWSPAPGIL